MWIFLGSYVIPIILPLPRSSLDALQPAEAGAECKDLTVGPPPYHASQGRQSQHAGAEVLQAALAPPALLLQFSPVPTLYGVQRCRAGSRERCMKADKPAMLDGLSDSGQGRPSERHGIAASLHSLAPSAPCVAWVTVAQAEASCSWRQAADEDRGEASLAPRRLYTRARQKVCYAGNYLERRVQGTAIRCKDR